jgi:DNA polymerase-3 subunit alpha
VLPPDVGESFADFAAVGSDIRFGLGAVRNVGAHVVAGIRETREADGSFQTFHDFLKRVPLTVLNKRTLESLIKAGAFDSFGDTRRALMEIHENAVESAVKEKRDAEHGNVGFDFDSLFEAAESMDSSGLTSQVPERPEWTKKDKLAFEREMLGLYVSDHPLRGLETTLAKEAAATLEYLTNPDNGIDGETVVVAGLLTSVQHRTAKSGNLYGSVVVEDFTGELQALFMGKSYLEYGELLKEDSIVALRGKLNSRDDGVSMHAYSVKLLDGTTRDEQSDLAITISETRATPELMRELRDVFSRHPGASEVRLNLLTPTAARVFELPVRVGVTSDLYGELKGLLGPRCLVDV